jgi:choline-glycine betaine transporter
MSVIIVVLLLTFLVTSADSAVLIINTIAAGGDASQKGNVHIITWGVALTLAPYCFWLVAYRRSTQR